MLTIYTGHHLNTVTPNIDIELSHLDAPETTIQKATDVFAQSKDTPVIIRTNDILFLDAIKALAMENDLLDDVTIIHMHEDGTNHWLKFDDLENVDRSCDYHRPLMQINKRCGDAWYKKLRKDNAWYDAWYEKLRNNNQ